MNFISFRYKINFIEASSLFCSCKKIHCFYQKVRRIGGPRLPISLYRETSQIGTTGPSGNKKRSFLKLILNFFFISSKKFLIPTSSYLSLNRFRSPCITPLSFQQGPVIGKMSISYCHSFILSFILLHTTCYIMCKHYVRGVFETKNDAIAKKIVY